MIIIIIIFQTPKPFLMFGALLSFPGFPGQLERNEIGLKDWLEGLATTNMEESLFFVDLDV